MEAVDPDRPVGTRLGGGDDDFPADALPFPPKAAGTGVGISGGSRRAG